MIELSFGTLPAGVVEGNPSTTTVELINTEIPQPNRYMCPPDAGNSIIRESVGEISQAGDIAVWLLPEGQARSCPSSLARIQFAGNVQTA
ncbi:MAG: hypothetical protein OXD46_09875 [Chloroflexi bacterium]|nr:hypothetical protein [Chloroflexota bacterium]